MDPSSMTSALIVIWFIQNLSFVGQEAAKEIGKGAGKGIVTAARELVEVVRKKLAKSLDPQGSQIVQQIERRVPIQQDQLASVIDQLTTNDSEFARTLNDHMQSVRNALLNTLDERFTASDLREVFFRLELSADKIAGVGTPHKTKAEILIEYMETRQQLPDLLQTMIDVNPTIL